MPSTLAMTGRPAIRRTEAPHYADLRSPGTPPRGRPRPGPGPRLDGVNPPPRTPGADLLWLVPLSVVVMVGSCFTNLARGARGAVGLPALAGGCASASVPSQGSLASLRWPLRGAVVTYAAVTAFVLARPQDGPIYLSLAAVALPGRGPGPGAGLAAGGGGRDAWRCARRWSCGPWPTTTTSGRSWQLFAVVAVTAAGAAIGTLARTRALAVDRAGPAAGHPGAAAHGPGAPRRRRARARRDRDAGRGRAARAGPRPRGRAHRARGHPGQRAGVAGRPARRAGPGLGCTDLGRAGAPPAAAGRGRPRRAGRPGPHRRPLRRADRLAGRARRAGRRGRLRRGAGGADQRAPARRGDVGRGPAGSLARPGDGLRPGRRAGLPATRGVHDEGMGLRGMRDRVQALGGELTAGPRPTGGFALRAVLPL